MKNIQEVHSIVKSSEFSSKIKLYLSSRSYGEDYDPETNNYTSTLRNPITIKGLVRQITPESAIWKVYGSSISGAVEIICEKKWKDSFKNCLKVEIDSEIYIVFRDTTGTNVAINDRPNNLIRVSLKRF